MALPGIQAGQRLRKATCSKLRGCWTITLLEGLGYDVPTNLTELEALSDVLNEQATAPEPLKEDFTNEEDVFDETAYNDAVDAWSKDKVSAKTALAGFDEVSDAYEAVDEAQLAVEEGLLATSDEALTQAIVDGWNATGAGPTTAVDVTPEVFGWVSKKMGVGEDQNGLIDDYIAQQPEEPAIDPEAPVTDEASVEGLSDDEIDADEIVEES